MVESCPLLNPSCRAGVISRAGILTLPARRRPTPGQTPAPQSSGSATVSLFVLPAPLPGLTLVTFQTLLLFGRDFHLPRSPKVCSNKPALCLRFSARCQKGARGGDAIARKTSERGEEMLPRKEGRWGEGCEMWERRSKDLGAK